MSSGSDRTNSDRKVVQTELPRDEYERLRDLANEEGKSLKNVVREAIADHVSARQRPDPSDPLFTEPAGDGDETDASDVDDYLYE